MAQTILVVEDDRNINEVVSEYLKDAGFIVLSRTDGAAALQTLLQTDGIDLFILDIMLPGLSGIELLKSIRTSDRHREKPVIMLTALGDEATQILSFDHLADDYVTKPFSPKILVRRVAALIRRTVGERKTLRRGGLVIDCDSYQVTQNGTPVRLTLREFELLHALAENGGKVLNRQQLLNYAWGYDYFGDERIVDVHIKNLRKKLSGDVISTVKGVGYSLRGDESDG